MPQQMTGPAGRAPWLPIVFVLAAAGCAAALGWTYWAFVRTTRGQFADESALRQAALLAPETKGAFLSFLDTLPTISLILTAAAILLVAVLRRRYPAAIVATGVIAASNLTTQLLKNVVLDRPDRGVETLSFNSLPSGHTTLAASTAAAVLLIVAPRWRPFAAAMGGAYSVLAGAATYVNLWHRPADVVAALLVVGGWTLLAGPVILRTDGQGSTRRAAGAGWGSSRRWLVLCWTLGVGGLVLSALVYLTVRADLPFPAPDAGRPLFFWWGLLWITGVGFVLAAATGSLLAAARLTGRALA
ncbi:phosphatase PAP2 family protein [Arthrobacter echini]|nr:phosphatase PAP2 family protein [Arthrobacter echini]